MNLLRMSSKHLSKGSALPPLQQGLLRVYSMLFCPFAQRTRLVLIYKNIPHETVNVDLYNRPDWFSERTPVGQVPVLEKEGQVIYDSVICNNYLDEVYPEKRLLPKDPFEKAWVSMMVDRIPSLVSAFFAIGKSYKDEAKMSEEYEKFKAAIKPFEDSLTGDFFGGDQPGMLDFHLWPFVERSGFITALLKRPAVSSEKFPRLTAWTDRMKGLDAVKQTILSTDAHVKYFQQSMGGGPMDLDGIAESAK